MFREKCLSLCLLCQIERVALFICFTGIAKQFSKEFPNLTERGKEKQMRSLAVMNRINVIIRPTTSGFNFSCLQAPHFDQVAIAGKEGNDKDWDRNRYRYRRY